MGPATETFRDPQTMGYLRCIASQVCRLLYSKVLHMFAECRCLSRGGTRSRHMVCIFPCTCLTLSSDVRAVWVSSNESIRKRQKNEEETQLSLCFAAAFIMKNGSSVYGMQSTIYVHTLQNVKNLVDKDCYCR